MTVSGCIASLIKGTLSPVSMASLTIHLPSITMMSAGIIAFGFILTKSPG